MRESAVPVTMGSHRFVIRDAGGILITSARFPAGARLEPHIHERATFAVMLEGGFDLAFTSPAIRRRHRECPPGTIFTEPACEKHGNDVGRQEARLVVLQPDPAREDLKRGTRGILDRISHFQHGEIVFAARRLAREVERWDDVSPLAAAGLALEMLAWGGRSGRDFSGDRPAWLRRAEEFIHAHFRDGLRIADVAEVAGEPPAVVATAFRRAHRAPLGSYVRRLRLEWVADQLAATETPVSTLAFEAGFADQSHLTRAFKRYTGVTPARYRRSREPARVPRERS